jgi:hypothetical protein
MEILFTKEKLEKVPNISLRSVLIVEDLRIPLTSSCKFYPSITQKQKRMSRESTSLIVPTI